MGKILNDKSVFFFKGLEGPARVEAKGARPLILRGRNDFLRIHAAGNKSGALQLTMFDFTIRRGDERLTKGGVASAVQEGDGQIGEGCLRRASPTGRSPSWTALSAPPFVNRSSPRGMVKSSMVNKSAPDLLLV